MQVLFNNYKSLSVLVSNVNHGMEGPEVPLYWLHITNSQNADLGGVSSETLGQWCRATTGQAGTLRLDREDGGTKLYVYDMMPCRYSLLQTVIPSVEYENTGKSVPSDRSSTKSGSIPFDTVSAHRSDCPDNLVSSFLDDPEPSWRRLPSASQSGLRKKLLERDHTCVFTGLGDPSSVQAVRFVRKIHPFWNLVHITCTRAHLSELPASLLKKVTGLYDTCVAALISTGMHGPYDGTMAIGFSVLEQDLQDFDPAKASITLEAVPLSTDGTTICRIYRSARDICRPTEAPTEQLRSVPIMSTTICGTEPTRIQHGREAKAESSSIPEVIEISARPFDIYVEFGLGARIMKLFGTSEAKEVSRLSPLTANCAEARADMRK